MIILVVVVVVVVVVAVVVVNYGSDEFLMVFRFVPFSFGLDLFVL